MDNENMTVDNGLDEEFDASDGLDDMGEGEDGLDDFVRELEEEYGDGESDGGDDEGDDDGNGTSEGDEPEGEDDDGEFDLSDDEDEGDEDGESDENEEEESEGELEGDGNVKAEDGEPSAADAPDARDDEIAELKRQLAESRRKNAAYESQSRETLKKIGENVDGDPLDALAKVAADAEGKSLEEYKREREDIALAEEGRRMRQASAFETKAAADLAEVQKHFPTLTGQYTNIRDMPPEILSKFGRFRDAGLSPKEAYAAANPDGIREATAKAAEKNSLKGTKNHLHSVVGKKASDGTPTMTRREIREAREFLGGDVSDKEILELNRQVLSKNVKKK